MLGAVDTRLSAEDMAISPLAGLLAPKAMLIDPAALEREYFQRQPDLGNPSQLVSFGPAGTGLHHCAAPSPKPMSWPSHRLFATIGAATAPMGSGRGQGQMDGGGRSHTAPDAADPANRAAACLGMIPIASQVFWGQMARLEWQSSCSGSSPSPLAIGCRSLRRWRRSHMPE